MPDLPLNCEEQASFESCKQTIIAALEITEQEFDLAYLTPMQELVVYNPEIYPAVEDSNLHVFATDATAKYPSLYIAYTYDSEKIYLWFADLNLSADGSES